MQNKGLIKLQRECPEKLIFNCFNVHIHPMNKDYDQQTMNIV